MQTLRSTKVAAGHKRPASLYLEDVGDEQDEHTELGDDVEDEAAADEELDEEEEEEEKDAAAAMEEEEELVGGNAEMTTAGVAGGDADDAEQFFSLRSRNFQEKILPVFHQMFEAQSFVDVSLACEEQTLRAHKVVLSANSPYFKRILLDNPCKHPTVIMPGNLAFEDLRTVVEYMYRGEIDVLGSSWKGIIDTAKQLQVKGLCDLSSDYYADSVHLPTGPGPEQATHNIKPAAATAAVTATAPPPIETQSASYAAAAAAVAPRRSRAKRQRHNNMVGDENFATQQQHPQHMMPTEIVVEAVAADDGGTSNNMTASGAGGDAVDAAETGLINSVSMGGFMDFAVVEPAAPTATPVAATTGGVGNVFLDSSSATKPAGQNRPAVATETANQASADGVDSLQLLQPIASVSYADGRSIQLTSTPTQQLHPHHQQQQQQQHAASNVVDEKCVVTHVLGIDADATVSDVEASNCSTGGYQMEVNVASIKDEPGEQQQQQQQQQQQPVASDHHVNNGRVVTMMTQNGDLVEMYQSDSSDDTHIEHANQPNDQPLTLQMDTDSGEHHAVGGSPSTSTPVAETPTASAPPATSPSAAAAAAAAASSVHPKTWTQANMDAALEALRAQTMSLTKASTLYGIPSTTLWQRAHRLGIDTPKKEGPSKTWSDDSLNNALDALRNGEISANKASKAFGIPSSTLYKIARREGIRLAAPFNAAPTNWSVEDLERALESIRTGATSVQKASLEFGIPTGTLYGRCKREGIELSRSNPTPWSEENMMEALESVRLGVMSINQAAIHFNLPYSSLYGRFKRVKPDADGSGSGAALQQLDQNSSNSYELSPNSSFPDHAPQIAQ